MKVIKWMLAVVVGCLIFLVFAFETSKVSLTPSGSYKALYPLFGIGIKGNLFITGATDNLQVDDYPFAGPIISKSNNDAKWFCRDKVHNIQLDEGVRELSIECEGTTYHHQWHEKVSTSFNQSTSEQVLVLSDIHGDIDYLDSVLQQIGVTNNENDWSWQQNQLVILGDSVDKGPADRRVLWRLYQLSHQAQLAGGAVHVLLGNHEQYGLDGNHFAFHPDLRAKVKAMTLPSEAYSENTVIGNWLRSRPVMLKLGKILFVHGGLSNVHLSSDFSIADINSSSAAYYTEQPAPEAAISLTKGEFGVTKYRGQLREEQAQTPTLEQLKTILELYNAEVLIVGHSQVEKLTPSYDGIVWPAHAPHKSGQVLLIRHGDITVKKLTPNWYDYDNKRQIVRNFSFINKKDLEALAQMLSLSISH